MAEAIRDANRVTNMLMESSTTPGLTLNVKGDQATGRLLVDNSGAGTGTVTSIATAGLISGGTITTTGTITTSMATGKLVGRSTAGTGIMEEITVGSGLSLSGGTLTASGAGTGDVVGPASSTDNAAVRFDSTTGKLIQNSAVIIADTTGNISGSQKVTVGVAGAATGSIDILGTTSGTVTVKTADVAGTWTLTLPTTDGNSGEYLQTNGSGVTSWAAVTGTGDVVGPASATDNAIARYDGTTGKLIQNSGVTIGDSNDTTITIADTTNVKGLTIYANDTTNKPLGLQIGGDAAKIATSMILQINDSTGGLYSDIGINAAGSNPVPGLYFQSTGGTLGTPTASPLGDRSIIKTFAYNSSDVQKQITSIKTDLVSATASSETANIVFSTISSGTLAARLTLSGTSTTLSDANNIVVGSTTGTKIGTATTQKLAFYNSTPIVQPTGDVVTALQNLGLVASATIASATNINTSTESSDTTCFPVFVTASGTQTLPAKTNTTLTYNASTSALGATLLTATTSVTSASILASSNDSGAIGASGTAFSDLFLASGAVINFAAGNIALTHSTGNLTMTGGVFNVNRAGVTTVLTDTTNAAATIALRLANNKTGANNDNVAAQFNLSNSAGTSVNSANIYGVITDVTPSTESGAMDFSVKISGADTKKVRLAGSVLSPVASDGTALGSTTLMWSDLFLASGAVLNFNNGNSVITHSSGVLEVTTGDLRVTTAGTNTASVVTVGGTQTLTNKTLTSPTITTATLSGAQQLAEGAGLRLDATLSADGTYSGTTIAGTAGTTLAFGDLVYLAAADSRWELVDADSATTCGGVWTGMCVLAAAADGDPTVILLNGNIRADAAFPTLTIGAPVYASTTAGDVQVAQPSGSDDVIHVIGKAITADSLYFNPSMDYITHV